MDDECNGNGVVHASVASIPTLSLDYQIDEVYTRQEEEGDISMFLCRYILLVPLVPAVILFPLASSMYMLYSLYVFAVLAIVLFILTVIDASLKRDVCVIFSNGDITVLSR